MKLEELMINDWVTVNSKTGKVMFVAPTNALIQVAEDEGIDSSPEDVEPISITRDILKLNGWITDKDFPYSYYKIDDHNQLEYYHYERRLRRIYEGVDEWENHSLVRDITFQCNCTYIHELQHALRMAGVLEEIKL